jgi:nucleoside-diphosphate-sugar epimerase
VNVFVTGAAGYIGGSVATRLVEAGHGVRGLVRSPAKADAVRRFGVEPVPGDLDDHDLLAAEARRADAVVNAASSDHRGAVEALVGALAGSCKPLLHTSGSSIVATDARGEASDAVFGEDTPFEPTPDKAARVAIDRFVTGAAARGVRSVVLCNTLIYGRGLGPHQDSIQIPCLARQARRSGVPRHIGPGRNVWSTVHVEDVADLYLLALAGAKPGSFMFVENGEASFRDMAGAVGRALGLGEAQPWPMEAAVAEWGFERAAYALGSNSRVRGGAPARSSAGRPATPPCWTGSRGSYPRLESPAFTSDRHRRAQGGDGGGVVGLAEHGRARDQHIGPGGGHRRRGLGRDPAVDLNPDRPAGGHGLQAADLLDRRRDEALAPETRVHGHDQDEVDPVEHVLDDALGRGRVQRHARRLAEPVDHLERAVEVGRGLGVDDDPVRPGLGERLQVGVDRGDHQVRVEALGRAGADRAHDVGPEADVRDEVAVHDVEVDPVGAGGVDGADLLA